jgi:quercetin dioxygenase-like cupin family protein
MKQISRRSALSVAIAATTVVARTAPALAQGSALSTTGGEPKGVTRKDLGKRDSVIPAYKSVEVHDLIYQPGAKSSNTNMPCDMVCQATEGELRVTKKAEGQEFTAKGGDVWTCRKGDDEAVENIGTTVAVMRAIFLMT